MKKQFYTRVMKEGFITQMVEGKEIKTLIPEFKDYKFFYTGGRGYWKINEYSTGMIVVIGEKLKDLQKDLDDKLKSVGIAFYNCVAMGIKNYGIAND